MENEQFTKNIFNDGKSFLEANAGKSKQYLIKKLVYKFNVSENEAIDFYYNWKCSFLNNTNCVPQDKYNSKQKDLFLKSKRTTREKFVFKKKSNNCNETMSKFKIEGDFIIGKYGKYSKVNNHIVFENKFFKSIEDVEKYKKKRFNIGLINIDNILNEIISIMNSLKLGQI